MAYSHEIGRAFWFALDKRTKYNQAFMSVVLRSGAAGVQDDYARTRNNGTYPAAFIAKFVSRKTEWDILAKVQTETIQEFLGADWADIQAAFEDFGQGVLLDTDPERQGNNDSIHTMDVQDADSPPVGYHRWHGSVRVIQLLQIGASDWWESLDRMIAFAWGIQSFARPLQQSFPNPPVASSDLDELRNAWLGLVPDRRDRQYDSTGPVGYHPSPKQPVP